MAFEEDLDQFFDQSDFAVAAVIKTAAGATVRTINVIFTDPLQDVAVFDTGAEVNVPVAQCETSDLQGVRQGYTMTIGGVVYRIGARPDDGTGVSNVELKKQ